MTPLLGRFMEIGGTEHDQFAHAYLEGFSEKGRATVAGMTAADKALYYEFFLLLRALSGAKAAKGSFTKLIVHGFKDCHLRCTYCIADMSKPTSAKLDIETVRKVAKKHSITAVHLIGGEPSYDWDHLFRVLDELPFVRDISLTTNGLGLTQKHIESLYARCPEVAFHVSVEPESWGTRIFENGKHQNEALRKVFAKIDPKLVFKSQASCVNIVLPVGYGDTPSHSDLTVDQVIAEISEVLHYDSWVGSWQIEGVLEGDLTRELPPWLVTMLQGELDYLMAADRGKARFMQGPLGTRVARADAVLNNTGFPGTFFVCTVGGDVMHLSHNDKVYACSISASRGEGGDCVATENFDANFKWQEVCGVLPALTNDVCRQCPAHFVCGRTCGKPAKALCENTRLRAEYTPFLLEKYMPEAFARFTAQQEKFLGIFMRGRDVLEPLLRSPAVKALYSGDASNIEAAREPLIALGALIR